MWKNGRITQRHPSEASHFKAREETSEEKAANTLSLDFRTPRQPLSEVQALDPWHNIIQSCKTDILPYFFLVFESRPH